MPDWTTINGLEVPDATPTGAAGLALKNNFELLADRAPNMSTSDPTTTDDSEDGFVVGSRWLNTSSLKMWICTDNTLSAAAWKPLIRWDTSTDDVNFDSDVGIDGTLQRISSGSNAELVLKPKGNGAFQNDDGGNARGTEAVDLQMFRNLATQVASGQRSILGGGAANTGSGTYSIVVGGALNLASNTYSAIFSGNTNVASGSYATVVGGNINDATATYSMVGNGQDNTASANYTIVGCGYQNVASGTYAGVLGGRENTASGTYAAVSGGLGAVASNYGQQAHAAGYVSSPGDAQTSVYVARGVVTSSSWTEIFLDGSSTRLAIPTDATWLFNIFVVGRRSDDKSAAFQIQGGIANRSGTTEIFGNTDVHTIANDALLGWDVRATADNTNQALKIEVDGSNDTIHWVARIETVEIVY